LVARLSSIAPLQRISWLIPSQLRQIDTCLEFFRCRFRQIKSLLRTLPFVPCTYTWIGRRADQFGHRYVSTGDEEDDDDAEEEEEEEDDEDGEGEGDEEEVEDAEAEAAGDEAAEENGVDGKSNIIGIPHSGYPSYQIHTRSNRVISTMKTTNRP
jgi:hypothetical protein